MKTLISNVFVVLYVAMTLFVRIFLEPQLQGKYALSMGIGAFALLFLWALIKSGIISPTILGLNKFGPK